MSRKPEDVIAGKNRPFTGQEYLESLRDDREVYCYGERVRDVTAHPAFRNAARSIAKLYDARSVVAHSGSSAPDGALGDTYELVKRLIGKIINGNHVPTPDEIEGELFGSDE